MKLTLFVCDRCGTIMQTSEKPAGWQEFDPRAPVENTTHYCKSCVGNLIEHQYELVSWPDDTQFSMGSRDS